MYQQGSLCTDELNALSRLHGGDAHHLEDLDRLLDSLDLPLALAVVVGLVLLRGAYVLNESTAEINSGIHSRDP